MKKPKDVNPLLAEWAEHQTSSTDTQVSFQAVIDKLESWESSGSSIPKEKLAEKHRIIQTLQTALRMVDTLGEEATVLNQVFQAGRLYQGIVLGVDVQDVYMYQKLKTERLKAELPLKILNNYAQAVKKQAQRLAIKYWVEEKAAGETISRISDMAQKVWQEMLRQYTELQSSDSLSDEDREALEGLNNALPDRAEGLRPHIRPVAPNEAAKPGRPKKK